MKASDLKPGQFFDKVRHSEPYDQTEKSIKAIMAVMDWLDVCRFAMTDATNPLTDQLDAELRDAMTKTAQSVSESLSSLAGPIWGELPSDIREQCRKAGM